MAPGQTGQGLRLILHIGLPKTATTSIQSRLSEVRPLLSGAGLCFPGRSVWHHELVKGLEAVEAGRIEQSDMVEDLLTGFAAEARQTRADKVLISCENMSMASPGTVRRIAQALRRHFPAAQDVTVLCYLREPVGFATSMIQQMVKSGTMRLDALYATPWQVNLRQALQTYADVFGKDSLCLRPFDPAQWPGGDVVADMLAAMGVRGLALPGQTPVLNTALSREAVQIGDALTAIRPRGKRRRHKRRTYKRLLEEIGGSRFVLPEPVQDLVIDQSRADLQALRDDYGMTLVPRRQPVPELPSLPDGMAAALARMIERLAEEGPPVTGKG